MALPRRLPWDWHDGLIPESAILDDDCFVETSYHFLLDRSRPPYGVRIAHGCATWGGTQFDVGPRGVVTFGPRTITNGARFICDEEITIGACSGLAWNVIVMDTRRMPYDPSARRAVLESVPGSRPRRPLAETPTAPVHIGSNVWIGFDAIVMPGVEVGDGAVIGSRAVVWDDVEPYTVVVGNPARKVRTLEVDPSAVVPTPEGPATYADLLAGRV